MAQELSGDKQSRDHYQTSRRLTGFAHTNGIPEEDDFYENVSIVYYFLVFIGFAMFEIFCFQTDSFPFKSLGGPGRRLQYLAENFMPYMKIGFFGALLLHVLEAFYSYFQCRSLNLTERATKRWVLQTLIIGYMSLKALNTHVNEQKLKQKKW